MAHWAHDRVNVIVHTANSAPCNRKDGMTFTQKKKKKKKKEKEKAEGRVPLSQPPRRDTSCEQRAYER